LRGNALAPQGYKPVDSAVRDEAEVTAMLAVSSIKGGIRVGGKPTAAGRQTGDGEREPVLAGKG
jgi:geranylgeranyl reductase